jgi:ketosteroid isomerase-like protein
VPVDERTLERLRRYYELWSEEKYAAARDLLFDPEIELIQPRELPGGTGVYRGYEGLERALREGLEAFDYYRPEPEQFAVGGDAVVVTVRLLARGRQTGMEVDARLGHLFVFRGERAVRWEIYLSPRQARAAAGLSDEAPD